MRKNTMISLVDTFLYLWIWLKNQRHKGEYVKKKKAIVDNSTHGYSQ